MQISIFQQIANQNFVQQVEGTWSKSTSPIHKVNRRSVTGSFSLVNN